MRCVLVSHSHWDREWYRTFQAFRARLVDLVDRVLDLVAADPGFRFLLDGQTVVVEDYLEIRPGRRDALAAACAAGRVAIGPWYVQPDSLLPSGEAHVRNLLEGRRGAGVGTVSRVAYCPDSFGHPAQLPQILRGFGLGPFVYWRGLREELDALPAEHLWEAPDGSVVLAHHLREGYFAAAGLAADPGEAARALATLARGLGEQTRNDAVLLMNGFDHALPDAHAGAVADALARATGWTVVRGLLEDFACLLAPDAPRIRGELTGARAANLLPGVWSARLPLKLRNRRAEALLEGWAEPWAALAATFGAPDERPALRTAWRALVRNQAHDSIGGCSLDRVHEQMAARYDAAEELAEETTTRALERLAGLGVERTSPWREEFDVAVFNPSPHARTDVVRFALVPDRWIAVRGGAFALHPWLPAALSAPGWTADGRPARLVADEEGIRLDPHVPPRAVETVVADVPAFGWRRVRLAPGAAAPDDEDGGTEIACDGMTVTAAADGTLALAFGARRFAGLLAVEDAGDRGDTYDFDPVGGGPVAPDDVRVRRTRSADGIQALAIRRALSLPAALAPDRTRRSDARVAVVLDTTVRLVPGTSRIDLDVRLVNAARDHRLRLLFPTGAPVDELVAATTFDLARRRPGAREAAGGVHPPPATFPHHGLVAANGLAVAAPGLPEAEVTPDGVIALTLVRAVGWLARLDLTTRPQPAGPLLPTPGAQCLGTIAARLALFPAADPRAARDAELGFRAVAVGGAPLLAPGRALLEVTPRAIVVTAVKPPETGPGVVVRVLNPTDAPVTARVALGFPASQVVPVRLDETPDGPAVVPAGDVVEVELLPHALRSLLVR